MRRNLACCHTRKRAYLRIFTDGVGSLTSINELVSPPIAYRFVIIFEVPIGLVQSRPNAEDMSCFK